MIFSQFCEQGTVISFYWGEGTDDQVSDLSGATGTENEAKALI